MRKSWRWEINFAADDDLKTVWCGRQQWWYGLEKNMKMITMTRIIFYRGKAGPRLHLLIPGGTASTSSHPQTCKILHFSNFSGVKYFLIWSGCNQVSQWWWWPTCVTDEIGVLSSASTSPPSLSSSQHHCKTERKQPRYILLQSSGNLARKLDLYMPR